MTSKVTEKPDTFSTARADLTDVSNLLYAAFMAADRLHDENDRRGMMVRRPVPVSTGAFRWKRAQCERFARGQLCSNKICKRQANARAFEARHVPPF